MVCRGMLLMLDRAGQIELPPVSYVAKSAGATSATGADAAGHHAHNQRLRTLQPLEIQQVRRTSDEPLFNSLMEEHHYLGYEQPVGEHLKYLVWAQGRPVACLAWCSAPRHIGSRDRYIGWSSGSAPAQHPLPRLQHAIPDPALGAGSAPGIAYSQPDGVTDCRRTGSAMYGHPVYFLETFVDPERFRGTCYRAANWQLLGLTTGRGKDDQTGRPNRSIKEVLGYAVHRRFRQLLSESTK